MRKHGILGVLFGLAILAIPADAGIKAMNLAQLMEYSHDTLHVEIVDKSTHRTVMNGEAIAYTKLTVVGESMRSLEPVSMEVVFFGSHDPADGFMISEMPAAQDVRVGNEVVMFSDTDTRFDGMQVLHNLGTVFRVERGFGTAVVMGKGEGSAFPQNAKLLEAQSKVRELAIQLEAAKLAKQAQDSLADVRDGNLAGK